MAVYSTNGAESDAANRREIDYPRDAATIQGGAAIHSAFERRLAESWPPPQWHGVTVLVAVSGGADSVALVRGLHALKSGGAGRLVVAHFNHRLRGAASDADEAFVVRLAHGLHLPCEVGRGDVASLADIAGDGLEAAARAARYDFLQATAERLGARYVATGHTADDQAETVLHRILRGTGLAGLAGMPRARPLGECASLLRPLLTLGRSETLAYLAQLEQPFCDDVSNGDFRYTRNRIRHDLLPLLAERYNPDIGAALVRLGSLAADAQQVVESLADELHERSVTVAANGSLAIECGGLSRQSRHLIRETLVLAWRRQAWPRQSMSQVHWDLLADLVVVAAENGESLVATFPGNIRGQRRGDFLYLMPG